MTAATEPGGARPGQPVAVSALIPAHNAAPFLERAIASVRAQGEADLEIVVVDDGSTDATPDIVARLAAEPGNPIVSIRTVNRGVAAARNTALDAARGDLIAFLDADDAWPAGRLAAMRARLARDPALDVVIGKVQPVREANYAAYWDLVDFPREPILFSLVGAALVRRPVYDRLGRFDTTLRRGEDMDWYFRLLEARVPLVVLDRVVLYYTLHDRNMSLDTKDVQRHAAIVVARSVARRRRAATGPLVPLPSLDSFLETPS